MLASLLLLPLATIQDVDALRADPSSSLIAKSGSPLDAHPGFPIYGRIVDPADRPIAGAEVALISRDAVDPFHTLVIDRGRSDSEGRFELELDADAIARADFRQPQVVAFHDEYGFAGRFFDLDELPVGEELELALLQPVLDSIQILDANGAPLVGLGVFPIAHPSDPTSSEGADDLVYPHRLPTELWLDWARTTDEQGRVALSMRREDLTRLGLRSDAWGTFGIQAFKDANGPRPEIPAVVRLPPLRERRFELAGVEAAGSSVKVNGDLPLSEDDSRVQLLFPGSVPLDASGRLTLHAPVGRMQFRLSTPDGSGSALGAFLADEEQGLDGPARLDGNTFDGLREFECRVVDSAGSPVSGLKVHVDAMGESVQLTDSEGRLRFASPSPFFAIRHMELPERFSQLTHPDRYARFEGVASEGVVRLDDLRLELGVTARGVVLQADGQPAAGALVVASQADPTARSGSDSIPRTSKVTLLAVTDAEGHFAVHRLSPRGTVGLTARLPGQRADLELAVAADSEPLELRMRNLLAGSARVRTPAGEPVAGLAIELLPAGGGREHATSELKTDANGRARGAPTLSPEQVYRMAWGGRGRYAKSDRTFTGTELAAGVALTAVPLGSTRGRLLNDAGEPLEGATVRGRRAEISTTTDADGAYFLEGLDPAGGVVVAELPSGAVRVGWARSGAAVRWSQAVAEPASDEDPAARRLSERELAEPLVRARIERAVEAGDDDEKLSGLRALAGLRPGAALVELERIGFDAASYGDSVRARVVDALLDPSPLEALGVARSIGNGMTRALRLIQVGARLEPAAEAELHLELIPELRAIQPPEHRVAATARLADRLLDLGSDDLAQQLLERAVADAEVLPTVEWPAYARSVLGEVLARVDREAGLALIRSMELQEDVPRHLGNLAHHFAAVDPAFGESLLEEISAGPGHRGVTRYASRVAYHMAPVDLARARGIAERYDSTGYSDGMIALALAGSQPSQARASLELAYERATDPVGPPGMIDTNPVFAALIPVAAAVDPEQLDGWIARSLRYEFPEHPSHPTLGVRAAGREAVLAAFLLPHDPALAGTLLRAALDRVEGDPTLESWDADVLWAASACADPALAVERAAEAGPMAQGLVAGMLSLTPERRLEHLKDRHLRLWYVGKEDL